jgi:hypothetical protein
MTHSGMTERSAQAGTSTITHTSVFSFSRYFSPANRRTAKGIKEGSELPGCEADLISLLLI